MTDETPPTDETHRDSIRIRFPRTNTDATQLEHSVTNKDVIAVAWHEHSAIGDALEVFPGDETTDNAVIMRDILQEEGGETQYGPVFAVPTDNLTDYEFVDPDGEDITPSTVVALAHLTTNE